MKTLDDYRTNFQQSVNRIKTPLITSPGLRGLIVGTLNKSIGDSNRKQFLKTLTGYASSKDLNEAEWQALREFMDPNAEQIVLSKAGEEEIRKVLAAYMPPQEELF